jgi:hypothetical protein
MSRKIFDTMKRETLADGASFALVLLPMEHHWWEGKVSNRAQEQWSQMVGAVCSDQTMCVELLPLLRQVPASEVDRGFGSDQWHFGPNMNRRIAASIRRQVLDALVH